MALSYGQKGMLKVGNWEKRRLILYGCIFFSLLTHALAITAIQKQALWFYGSNKNKLISKSNPHNTKNNNFLKQSFTKKSPGVKELFKLPSYTPLPEEEKEAPLVKNGLESKDVLEKGEERLLSKIQQMSSDHLLIQSELDLNSLELPISLDHHGHLLDDVNYPYSLTEKVSLPQEKKLIVLEQNTDINLSKRALEIAHKKANDSNAIISIPSMDISKHFYRDDVDLPPALETEIVLDKPIAQIPTLNDLDTASVGDCFDIDLVFLPKGKEGYIFALTLIPKPEATFPKLGQNFYFIIDKSNAIQKNRLKMTLNAVFKSLTFLNENDTFNILAYDGKFERMSPQNLKVTKDSKIFARDFLNNLQLGSFFASADPFKPLNALLFDQIPHDDLATVILIGNGEGLSSQGKQSYFIHKWSAENAGRLNIYTVALQEDKNIATLDALSAINKGKLYTSTTMVGLKRKLMRLIRSIHNPIAKDIACSIISKTPNSNIQIFPSYQQMPPLFADQPFVLMGTIQNPEDFILFIQGKQKDAWLNIKKNISFLNAKKGETSLEQQWALQKTYNLYEKFIRDGNPEHLQQANNLLQNYNMKSVF